MATLNVSLTPELVALIDGKVQSGMYHSASEVVREGLRLLKQQDETRRMTVDELQREIAVGAEDFERGDYLVFRSGNELGEWIKVEGSKNLTERKADRR